ncbi:CHASE2 and HATPase_c domain-containing protein [uncultured Castellaniella sp.]|uniref:CHASE2 and HATPase_c domain-containing protein n=1 Tax=uncultured Castellaniella sp. TaxID=647907 RepID=UPI00262CA10A|nr:CHASE2 and HATPase_c domain-containing protein [uncultured Castellaniella sp.]
MSRPSDAYPTGLQRRLRAEWLGLALALSLLIAALSIWGRLPVLRDINQQAYDLSMQLTPRPAADRDIVVITIDDASIEALGYWPWRRATHAALLPHLRLARAVVLDLILSDSRLAYPGDDALLAAAIAAHRRVVLPEVLGPEGRHVIRPLPVLADAAAAIGRIDAQADPDGRLRAIQLWRTTSQGARLPHLSVALARVAGLDAATERPDDRPSHLQFIDPARTFVRYPYAAVLRGEVPESAFENRIVLIGAWASGLGDQLPTAMGSGLTTGVEVLADSIQNLKQSLWIRIAPPWVTILASLCVLWLVCLGLRRLSPRHGLAGALAALLGFLSADAWLLAQGGLWIPPAGLLVAILLAYPLWTWRIQEASLQHIDRELERLQIHPRRNPAQAARGTGPDTLPERAARLHQAVSRLKAAARDQQDTLGFISHDMRSPQNAILAAIELRRQAPEQWTESGTLAHIEQQTHATLRLVDNFVQLARAESAPLRKHPCLLDDLVQDCCDQRWSQAAQRRITLRFDPSDHEDTIDIDIELMRRAIGNLLDNAIQYSFEGTEVRCVIERDASAWRIHVQDAGPGIGPDQIPHLFTRFWRAAGDGKKPAGNGLGLAFVQAVAQRHGGQASCASEPGRGSRFSIHLPPP